MTNRGYPDLDGRGEDGNDQHGLNGKVATPSCVEQIAGRTTMAEQIAAGINRVNATYGTDPVPQLPSN